MPNWVHTVLNITGPSEDLLRLVNYVAVMPDFAQDDQKDLSFHSFITPTDMTKEQYSGIAVEVPIGEETPHKPVEGSWYSWNSDNWGTKWDACDVSTDITMLGETVQQFNIYFDTAWGPASQVVEAMSIQYPTLEISVYWEEEQGFGEEYELLAGNITNATSWDIPDSHADYVERDRLEGCMCADMGNDKDDWYDDCPGKVKVVYVVEVVTKYYISANNKLDAILAAQSSESGYDLPAGAEVKSVEYAEEYRAVGEQESNDD
jgi:hypothetical protein